jgi:hypothetical protein
MGSATARNIKVNNDQMMGLVEDIRGEGGAYDLPKAQLASGVLSSRATEGNNGSSSRKCMVS